jgi:hypothetical protein
MHISILIAPVRDAARHRLAVSFPNPSNGSTSESKCSRQSEEQALTVARRLSELQSEADELRRKLRTGDSSSRLESPLAVRTAVPELRGTPESLVAITPATSPPRRYGYENVAPLATVNMIPSQVLPQEGHLLPASDSTLARTLNGIRIESDEIDDIFKLYRFYTLLVYTNDLIADDGTDSSGTLLPFCQFWIRTSVLIHTIRSRVFCFG